MECSLAHLCLLSLRKLSPTTHRWGCLQTVPVNRPATGSAQVASLVHRTLLAMPHPWAALLPLWGASNAPAGPQPPHCGPAARELLTPRVRPRCRAHAHTLMEQQACPAPSPRESAFHDRHQDGCCVLLSGGPLVAQYHLPLMCLSPSWAVPQADRGRRTEEVAMGRDSPHLPSWSTWPVPHVPWASGALAGR